MSMHPEEERGTASTVETDVSLPMDGETTSTDICFSNNVPVLSRTPAARRRQEEEDSLRRLEVQAALEAALAAKLAVRWAALSTAIALAALVVAAWPHIAVVFG
jgi:hypothetical protein